MEPIINYIQYLAINSNSFPDQKEYKEKFGGKSFWAQDAVNLCKKMNVKPLDIKSNLENLGVKLGSEKTVETAGMRRQYFVDCLRTRKVITL